MRNYKEIIKVIYHALKAVGNEENRALAVKFGENIMENVQIVMELASPIIEAFGYDMAFKSRGIEGLLLREIVQELEMEEQRNAALNN